MAIIIIIILIIILAIISIFLKEKVIKIINKVKDSLVWNGLIRTFQMSYLKMLVNAVM